VLAHRKVCESEATHQFQCSRSSKYQSATLRTSRLQVRVLPGVPFCRVSPTTRDASLRTERSGVDHDSRQRTSQFSASILWRAWEAKSLTRHQFVGSAPAAHVVQRRDGALKTRTVSVQIRPWAPSACSPMKRRPAQTGKVAGASPATRTNFFWNANRTSESRCIGMLTSACPIRACGASPRHSAIGV
jgi:hypothetical protein